MATQAQIEANRRNAEKSTGPKTEEGKTIVARNAIKHGIFCQHLLLPGESQEELDSLRQGIYKRLRPADELEKLYAERIVVAAWKIRRLLANESGDFEDSSQWCPVQYDIQTQQKMISTLERAMDKALTELTKLQKNRPENQDDPEPVATASSPPEENKLNSSQTVAEAPINSDAPADRPTTETNPIADVDEVKSIKTNPISPQPLHDPSREERLPTKLDACLR